MFVERKVIRLETLCFKLNQAQAPESTKMCVGREGPLEQLEQKPLSFTQPIVRRHKTFARIRPRGARSPSEKYLDRLAPVVIN